MGNRGMGNVLINGPRGTKDILPDTVAQWLYLEERIRDICRCYGYREIRTPIFEHTELFLRGIGETTDVVEKEMYTFPDRGGRSLTLRPENTASAVRSYLQNKLYAAESIVKLFYMGSMFRYDRPQAGRYREFHQFGVEALGEINPSVDVEIILLAIEFLRSLGLEALVLHLNSVGCPKCRPAYREKLQAFFRPEMAELCTDCQSRFARNPLRILDCKNEHCHALSQGAPRITDCLCDECKAHFDKVQSYLKELDVPFELDSNLVRGLDYYTKTAFEVQYTPLGAQSAVAGGGRYDGLVEEIGGDATPGIGFAIGLERVLLALEKQELLPEIEEYVDVFFVALGEAAEKTSFKLMQKVRAAGLAAAMDFAGRSLKAQMKQANKKKSRFVAILGEDEVKDTSITLKNMKTSEQKKIVFEELIPMLSVGVKN